MRYVRRMWENLCAGRTFDVVLVVAANAHERDRIRSHFRGPSGWSSACVGPAVEFASLGELGRPWRGGNFDASLFAMQRIRRLLRQRGVAEGEGKGLAVLVAGQGTRAYPLTAAEGGNKSMIQTPAQLGHRSLRLVELVLAQYHQILDEIEPGRIHVAAGDHLLAWSRPPRSVGMQHVQIFANRVSFAEEAEDAGLLDADHRPLWSDAVDLRRRLGSLDVPRQLPVLHSLTQMGLLTADPDREDLRYLVEKADVASILEAFALWGGEARVNWWDWSVSPEAARLLVRHYADLMGWGIDFSTDVLEPVTMAREHWIRWRPHRDPQLWDRANALFENRAAPGYRPLGSIGVADPGERSVFADLGTLNELHDAYASALEETEKGERCRTLMGARLEGGALLVGERPGGRVEVEPGSIVIEGAGISRGRVSAGSIVVDTKVGELRTEGRCIVYGLRAPGTRVRVGEGEVVADVVHRGRRLTVRGSLFRPPKREGDPMAWYRPQYGNPMSFSELQDGLAEEAG